MASKDWAGQSVPSAVLNRWRWFIVANAGKFHAGRHLVHTSMNWYKGMPIAIIWYAIFVPFHAKYKESSPTVTNNAISISAKCATRIYQKNTSWCLLSWNRSVWSICSCHLCIIVASSKIRRITCKEIMFLIWTSSRWISYRRINSTWTLWSLST